MNKKDELNLFLLTDSFPFGKGEDFIANELDIISKSFKKVYVIPTGIMCDTSIKREMPNNFEVFIPPKVKYLYTKSTPNKYDKIYWSLRYLSYWCLKSFFCKDFISELKTAILNRNFNFKKISIMLKYYAPCLRNISYFKKNIKQNMFAPNGNVIYSFWFDSSQYMMKKIMIDNDISANTYCFSRGHRHDIYENESACGFLPFRKLYFESVDALYLSTKDGYNYMYQNYPDYTEKIHLSYLGTHDYGIKNVAYSKPLRIVSCSFLSPIKRVNLIIDALSEFGCEDIEWIHFGDGLLMDEIKEYASNKLAGKIKYSFMGYVPNKDMIDFYSKVDVHLFVNTSESEGLPVSIQEAISFGIPIIATDVGSTREAVINNRNGFLLAKNFTVETLYQYISLFYDMPEKEYMLYRKQSRILWEENFNAEQIYSEFFTNIKNRFSKLN